MTRFKNKVAIITGGGRGQGRSHAITFRCEGADVVVTDICAPLPQVSPYETSSRDDLEEAVRLAEKKVADARDSAHMQSVVATILETFGRIDTLSVNFGVAEINRLTRCGIL